MVGFSVPPQDRAARRVGTVLKGKYGIERLLGVGGMATVYMAVHRNGRRIAIKLLHEELAIHGDVRARFVREGYVANAVGHEGAVRVFDDDITEDGAAFLVMELLEGETLSDRCQRRGGRLPCVEVLALAHRLLDVLAAAHARGIVHRDIKPENLFFTSDRQLKILDFGIARMKDDPGAMATVTGARIGTPAFMPPEQALGRAHEIDARTDLWAVGATMFSLLAGRTVHVADSAAEMIVITATTPPRPLEEVEPSLPREVTAVVDRALRFTRDARWPSAREMQGAIEEAHLAAFGRALAPADVGPPPEPRLIVPWTEDERETRPLRGEQASFDLLPQDSRSTVKQVEAAPTWPSDRPLPLPPLAPRSSGAPAPSRKPASTPPASPTLSSTPAPAPVEETPRPRDSAPVTGSRDRRAVLIALLVATVASAIVAFAKWSARPAGGAAGSGQASQGIATPPACKSNADCKGERPAICRKDDGVCVALTTDQCKVLAAPGDVENDATVWIGAMFPTSNPEPLDYGPVSANAIELARRDFAETTGGLPPRPGGPRRPIGVVLCDDREAPERAAEHLVRNVRVPAILGFARSKEVLDLSASLFLPNGVLALAANTASALRDIPRAPGGGPRLVFRVTTSADMLIPAVSAVLSGLIEPEVRAQPGVLGPGEPMRVALVRVANPSGQSYADGFVASLRFNGKSVAENGPQFRQIVTADLADFADPRDDAQTAEKIRAFLPHAVLPMGGGAMLVPELERIWPESERFRPRYIKPSAHVAAPLAEWVRKRPELRKRYHSLDADSTTEVLTKFVLRYNEVFAQRLSPVDATSAPYDAFYLFAYAAAALGDRPITGTGLAGAIARLLPGGERIDVGSGGIYRAYYALAAGKNIDLQGAMTSLDFDLQTGDATADFALYCLSPGNAAEAPRQMESGVFFRARSNRLEGAAHCP
jgi:serine/threonine protein kinase